MVLVWSVGRILVVVVRLGRKIGLPNLVLEKSGDASLVVSWYRASWNRLWSEVRQTDEWPMVEGGGLNDQERVFGGD